MKQAYPNFDANNNKLPVYNLSKWMDCFRDIYIKVHLGANKTAAVNEVCNDWGTVEKREFLNWMKYYESGDYLKYKVAQNAYYVNDDINYFLPNPKAMAPSPIKSINDQIKDLPQQAQQIAEIKKQEGPSPAEKRQQIEMQRKKILGRLNSVEKLLSSQDGHMFAGPDFERLLISIYELKKQIQTVNKISVSAQTCIDLIVRQANILKRDGFDTASAFMVKFAQNSAGELNSGLGAIPAGGSAPEGLGALNNPTPDLSATPPGLDNLPTDTSAPIPSGTGKDGIDEFLDNLEGAGITDEIDESKIEDDNALEDEVDVGNDDVLLDQEIAPNGKDDLFVEAQLAPPAPDLAPAPKPRIPKDDVDVPAPLEVSEDKMPPKKPSVDPETPKSDVDMLLDNALQNVSVQDLIQKLDDVATIFRNREISRQLAICDIIFSKLGIASYFSEFSECINKSFDSGNYILTRLESTLSKLRGAVGASSVDLESQKAPQDTGLQKTLKGLEDKEKSKKEMRQQLSDKKMQEQVEGGEKPELEVEEIPDLTKAPSKAEAPAPMPVPKTPPPAV